jgi:hypothetical protein
MVHAALGKAALGMNAMPDIGHGRLRPMWRMMTYAQKSSANQIVVSHNTSQ